MKKNDYRVYNTNQLSTCVVYSINKISVFEQYENIVTLLVKFRRKPEYMDKIIR